MLKKFKGLLLTLMAIALVANVSLPALAQNPTGSIRGVVKDPQGAIVGNANISAKNTATGEIRKANTGQDGIYTISNLLPAQYEVTIEASGFKQITFPATVEVGSSVAGDVTLEVGGGSEIVDIAAGGQATLEKESNQVAGVINKQKIDAMPLNGRNFLQLALLEPGVAVITREPGSQNNIFNVSIGGANSALTRLTVDGGSIVDPVCGGAAQNFSTETVQEFQISTFNFDLSTGVTSVGAINIVSRSGGNEFHGSGFLYFRDNKLSAVPTLQKPTKDFDPFFRRYQYGGSFGGPIKKDKAFFFGNIEWLNQDNVVANIATGFARGLSQFNTTFPSPYDGVLLNTRGDFSISDKNKLFTRYSFDDNKTLAPDGANILPSRWRDNRSRDHNVQAGLTTLFTNTLVNDFRFNYQRITNDELIPTADQCPPSDIGCFGLGGVQINFVTSNLAFGNTVNAPQNRRLNRYQYVETLSWEKGAHRLKFGGEWEHNYGFGKWAFLDPGLLVLYDPEIVLFANNSLIAGINAAPLPQTIKDTVINLARIPLPAAFTTPGATITLTDILNLPLAAGAVGIGDPSQPPPFNTEIARQSNRYRFYAQDSWRVRPNFNFLYGVAYQYETNLGNHDLEKPALLAKVIGDVGKQRKDKNNFAPSVGFTYDVGSKGKTVIRGGGGVYYDTVLFVTRLQERATNGPAGNGRSQVATAYFQNSIPFASLPTIPGLPAAVQAQLAGTVAAFNPALGTSINFVTQPTKFTAANFLTLLNQQSGAIQSGLSAAGAAGFSGLDFFKTGTGILDPDLETPYSVQFSIGFQHKLRQDTLLNVDFVSRRRLHTLFQTDGVRFNRVAALGGSILPKCVGAQAVNPTAQCANGSIAVTQSSGRSDYKAMLVKLDKRFANRYQLTASYALASRKEFLTGEDLNDFFRYQVTQGARHSLTVSGLVDLPYGIQGSLIAIYQSKEPFNARYSGSADFNGDGTTGDTLPGLEPFSLGRGTNKNELLQLVATFNATLAGTRAANGALIAPIALPTKFDFGDDFWSQDIRLSKAFKFNNEKYTANFFVEAFNILNISNLVGYSQRLNTSFGLPTGRAGQNFGTGGPRALQIGGRFSF